MRDGESPIQARYALTILRVAQGVDRQTAARLVWRIARDLPHPNERRAINSFAQLATALNDRLISGGSAFAPAFARAR